MDYCIRCDGVCRVNYSCYDTNEWEVYIHDDCTYWIDVEEFLKQQDILITN